MQIRKLGPLTWLVALMVVLNAAINPALLLAYHLSPEFYEMHVFSDLAYAGLDLAMVLWSLLTMIAFCWWVYRAGGNLAALGYDRPEYSPAARAGWFFVPFANLVIPYFGMRELWNASHGKVQLTQNVPLVTAWWGIWLLYLFDLPILNILAGPLDPPAPLWVQTVSSGVLSALAIRMLFAIARAQSRQRGPDLGEIFA